MTLGSVQPYSVMIGRIVGAYQATNFYDVVTDFGRFYCTYHGNSTGPTGVQSGGGLAPGATVWVAGMPGQNMGHILCVVNKSWTINPDSDPKQFAVYPQVSGLDVGKRLTGQVIREQLADIQNRPNDVMHDLVNGEWSVTSLHGGGGVGVEGFRTWVRGGPMSGLVCFHDTETTRLTGLDFEFMTLGRDDYIRRHGNSIVESRSKVFYPKEALDNALPRDLSIAGPIHGGAQRFLAPAGTRGVPRMALFHEMLADDGSYTVTSASTICLQRWCGITVPEEAQAPQIEATPELVGEQPLDADDTREAALQDPRPFATVPPDERSGVAWVQHSLDLIEGLVEVRGRGGFDRLPVQWPNSGEAASGVPADLFHGSYDASMWRKMPASFEVNIDPILKSKTFYVGRSSFTLLPDGSVLVEDAYHSQIMLSGGNILFSAPHDIIFNAGRNILGIAGKHAGIRAYENVDVASNTGAVNIKAEQQLSLLGGAGKEKGGVLIESQSLNSESTGGTGQDQIIGGILIKAATGVYATGARVGIRATEDLVVVESPLRLELRGQFVSAYAPTGLFVYHDSDGTSAGYSLSPTAMIAPGSLAINGNLDAIGGGLFGKSVVAGGSIAAQGSVIGSSVGQGKPQGLTKALGQMGNIFSKAKENAKALATQMTSILNLKTPLNADLASLLGFSFWTSKQLKTDTSRAYEIPETRWQSVSRRFGLGSTRTWTENPVRSPAGDNQPTAPFPGHEVWTSNDVFRLEDANLYVDLGAGTRILPDDISKAELPADPKVSLNGNFRIGADL